MEDTQMPSVGVPQAPQDANPNPPAGSSEQAPQSPTPKKGGGLVKALVGVFAVAIIGFGGWYAYTSGIFGGAEDSNPPRLELSGGAGFQGKSVDTTFGFQQYDADDVAAFDEAGMSLKTSTKSINFFNIKSPTDFAEIEASVKPTEDLKLLIVHFDKTEAWPGDPADKTYDGCFVTYPVGPYANTCEVSENDLANKQLNPGEVAILITNIAYEYDSNLLAESKTLGGSLNIPEGRGWSLHPITQNMEIPSNVTSVWVQTAQNDFEKAEDPDNIDISREYKMAWFKMTDEPIVDDSTPPAQEVAECGDGNVDSGEECDDGNTVDDDVCMADCTLPATDATAAPICGDGNVDEGETCDDGNNISGDGCSATCTIEKSRVPAPDTTKDSPFFTTIPEKTREPAETTEPTFQLAPLPATMMTTPSDITAISWSYIDNLQEEFTKDTSNFPDYLKGYLYGDTDDSTPKVVMAALRFNAAKDIGDLTMGVSEAFAAEYSNEIIHDVSFFSYGYSIDRPPADYDNYKDVPFDSGTGGNVYPHYCNGIGIWELNVRYEKDGIIYLKTLYRKTVSAADLGKEYFDESDKVENFTFTDNQKYIFTLEMTGLDHCRNPLPDDTSKISTSETNFSSLHFTMADGSPYNVQYQSSINNYDTHDHWINWLNTGEMPLEFVTNFTMQPLIMSTSDTSDSSDSGLMQSIKTF